MRIAVFISFFVALQVLVNFYIGVRGWQALEWMSSVRPYFAAACVLLTFSYLGGEILERKAPSFISDVLVWMGAFWFAFMMYFLIAIVAIDLVRLAQYFFHFLPSPTAGDYLKFKSFGGLVVFGIVSIVILFGNYNATHIHLTQLEISVDKPNPHDSLRMVMMSDMHLGTIISRGRITKMIDSVNRLKPDIVLLAGDEIDGNPGPVIKANLGDFFDSIKSTYGIYSITGNHEYIGDAETSINYLSKHNVTWLRDTAIEVAGVMLVGREDLSMRKPDGSKRLPLAEIMNRVDRAKPIIMMDHQPFHLEEAEQAGVDLQLSGHTHHAQMWPFNYITQKIYEVSWGYKMRGKTHYYVSCGVGTWGPPVRIGSYSEIVEITMHFNNSAAGATPTVARI